MAATQQLGQRSSKLQTRVRPIENGAFVNIPMTDRRSVQRPSVTGSLDLSENRNSSMIINGAEHQLIPVEIEKEAELGLVVGQIENEQYLFIDEILPNGMIEMHGALKEGDYLLQAGSYSLVGVDIASALKLIERAYDEGRKTIAFVGARAQKPTASRDDNRNGIEKPLQPPPPPYDASRKEGRTGSFIEYENAEEEGPRTVPVTPARSKQSYSKKKTDNDDAQF